MSICVKVSLAYYAVAVLVSIVMTVRDKRAAKRDRRRVPEKTLFLTATFGSAAAMYVTMRRIRHKTLHKRFMIGLPAIMAAKAVVVACAVFLCFR